MSNDIIKERLAILLKEGKIKNLENFIALGVITKEEANKIMGK